MSEFAALSDPTDLAALRGVIEAVDTEGRLVPLDLRRIVIAGDAVTTVADTVADELARAGREGLVVVLVDATPIQRAGDDLKALVHDALAARFPVRTTV